MPTKHRRIAIVRDEEVDRALKRARAVGTDTERPDAAVARDLVLRGADAVIEESPADEWERDLVEKYGARPAEGSMRELLDQLEPVPMDPTDPYRASRILEELREEGQPGDE